MYLQYIIRFVTQISLPDCLDIVTILTALLGVTNQKERQATRYNRVLIRHPGSGRTFKTSNGWGFVIDLSALPFLVEELVALGATGVAIRATGLGGHRASDIFPRVLSGRVSVIRRERQTLGEVQAIMAPILEEFGMVMHEPGLLRCMKTTPVDVDLATKVLTIASDLETFLLGLHYRLQIDVKLGTLKQCVNGVRRSSRNPDSRANLAVLAGILDTYEPQTVSCLALQPQASQDLTDLFKQFVQDVTYREISNHQYTLGFPARIKRSTVLIGRLVKTMVTKGRLKHLVKTGTKLISAASRAPELDTELAALLLTKSYLPPIVSLQEAVCRAHEDWQSAGPDFVPPDGFEELLPGAE